MEADTTKVVQPDEAGMCGWGRGGSVTAPIFSNLPESWSKVSHASGELATALPLTFALGTLVGQFVKTSLPPPTESVSGHH